ncbi:hypothetical protein NX059_006856 [Plenodomus lindquistii]|nr:hypothetical protein NX059_006856 [Plenodomus lindquistii]
MRDWIRRARVGWVGWLGSRLHVVVLTATTGFAISGGVDSMALAALYTRARKQDPALPPAHGFVVDHKVRPESTDEAQWVVEQLRHKLDVDSTILPLQWPADFDLSDLRRFETEARRLRYQALGMHCKERHIAALLVAHHADDQAETVLMRLSNHRLRSGLQAMHSVEWIPECEGLYGVHHSGNPLRLHAGQSAVEQGGMHILRPLLPFEKARLIATCEEADMPWAEDKTNKIPTLTARNAIRHIVQNHELPEALSVKSLVHVSTHMQKRVEAHKAYAAKLFDQCLVKLNIQTGSAYVRFPPFPALLDRPISTASNRNEASDNAYCLIKRVGELVSPNSSAPLDTLAATITRVYPELAEVEISQTSKNYCVFGTWWRACDTDLPFPLQPSSRVDSNLAHPRDWFLMRQPPSTNAARSGPKIEIKPGMQTQDAEYNLCDGRFWIRLTNLSSGTLTLRLITRHDLQRFFEFDQKPASNTMKSQHRNWLSEVLSLIKPSPLRLTLPAVFHRPDNAHEDTLIGFPTLDVSVHGFGAPETYCKWSVSYKKIDFGNHDPESMVMPRITEELVLEDRRHKGAARTKFKKGKRPRRQREKGAYGLPSRL